MIAMAALWRAVIDDPQRRFTVWALTSLGIGVRSWAKRATLNACSSVCWTQPQTMSSISAGLTAGLRRRRARITSADRVSARTFRKAPPLERPIGVRTASTTTASFMASLRVEAPAGGGEGGELLRGGVERAQAAVLLGGLEEGSGADRVRPAEDPAPERRETEAIQESDVHLDGRPDDTVLEAARGLEDHREHQALDDPL